MAVLQCIMKSSLLLFFTSLFILLLLFLKLGNGLLVFLLIEKSGGDCIRRQIRLWMYSREDE